MNCCLVAQLNCTSTIKGSNSIIFKNSLSASWLVRELSSPRLDWPQVGLSVRCPVSSFTRFQKNVLISYSFTAWCLLLMTRTSIKKQLPVFSGIEEDLLIFMYFSNTVNLSRSPLITGKSQRVTVITNCNCSVRRRKLSHRDSYMWHPLHNKTNTLLH